VEAETKTVGILGYGALGKRVADVATALGMKVVISQRPGSNVNVDHDRVSFEQMLAVSDVISLHCPLTPETRNLFSTGEFRQMKPGAFIINTARGAIIDSDALVSALREGEIAGAGIDVLDREPPVPDHPLLQPGIPNLLVTPHNAWGTRESRQRLVDMLGDNLQAWLSGNPANVIEG
jgi:glycerate dehydrogenase